MKYRKEIDGLRALAVLPVIFFHAGFSTFSGGFVGVDIFFVISGFLITTILLDDISHSRFSFISFYERRARRILPALMFVTLISLPFSWFLMLPTMFEDFSYTISSVMVFSSNILFWFTSDYFSPSSELNPMLHTWSLAVEEQFYVFFPILLSGLWFLGKRKLVIIIFFLAVSSLLLSIYITKNSPEAAFYLLPSRAWELLSGALLAFFMRGREQHQSGLLSMVGLLLILGSIFFFDKALPYPYVYALVPVLGSVLIIAYAGDGNVVGKLLSSKAFVGLGLISYSAYLWHQPIFAFFRLYSFSEQDFLTLLLLSCISLLCGYVSWRFIETPFRTRRFDFLNKKSNVFVVTFLSSVLFITFGLWGGLSNTHASSWQANNSESREIVEYLNYRKSKDYLYQFKESGCFISGSHESEINLYDRGCLSFSDTKKNYVLLGDSHAAHLYKALSEKFHTVKIIQANVSGCKPLLNSVGVDSCVRFYDEFYDEFLDNNLTKIDGIILSARWKESDAESLVRTLFHLKQKGIATVILGPTVEYYTDFPALLTAIKRDPDQKLTNNMSEEAVFKADDAIRHAARKSDVPYISVVESICTGRDCLNFAETKVPIQFDYGHFTLSGARLVVSSFPKDISQLFEYSE